MSEHSGVFNFSEMIEAQFKEKERRARKALEAECAQAEGARTATEQTQPAQAETGRAAPPGGAEAWKMTELGTITFPSGNTMAENLEEDRRAQREAGPEKRRGFSQSFFEPAGAACAFDASILRPSLRKIIEEVARATQMPPVMVFMAFLGALAICVQGAFKIRDGETDKATARAVTLSVIIFLLAAAGRGKSTLLKVFTQPYTTWCGKRREELSKEAAAIESSNANYEKLIAKSRNKLNPDKPANNAAIIDSITAYESMIQKLPAMPAFLMDDATPEKIAVKLSGAARNSLGIVAEEPDQLQIWQGKYSKDGMGSTSILKHGVLGEPICQNRISGNRDIFIKDPRLTFLCAVTNEPGEDFLGDPGLMENGTTPRCLFYDLIDTQGYKRIIKNPDGTKINDSPAAEARQTINMIFERALGCEPPPDDPETGSERHLYITLSESALDKATDAHIKTQDQIDGRYSHIKEHVHRYPEHVRKCAGLLHCAYAFLEGIDPQALAVPDDVMGAAVAFLDFLYPHMADFMKNNKGALRPDAEAVLKFVDEAGGQQTNRLISRKFSSHQKRDPRFLSNVRRELEALGLIEVAEATTGGRRSLVWRRITKGQPAAFPGPWPPRP